MLRSAFSSRGALAAIAAGATLAIASPLLAAETAILEVSAPRLLLVATKSAVEEGRTETDPAVGVYAVAVDVSPIEEGRGWTLYVRPDRAGFAPEEAAKPPSDLAWKLDHEGRAAFRSLAEGEQVVLARPEGGSAEVLIDVAVAFDWRTPPGSYRLGLVFEVRSE